MGYNYAQNLNSSSQIVTKSYIYRYTIESSEMHIGRNNAPLEWEDGRHYLFFLLERGASEE